jgi:hypothetical protein
MPVAADYVQKRHPITQTGDPNPARVCKNAGMTRIRALPPRLPIWQPHRATATMAA